MDSMPACAQGRPAGTPRRVNGFVAWVLVPLDVGTPPEKGREYFLEEDLGTLSFYRRVIE